MYIISKEIAFEAGHRLMDYKGPCSNLHGHNYILRLSLRSAQLDKAGFVVDFSEIKKIAQKYIKENVDHAVILNENDEDYIKKLKNMANEVYVIDGNPTAEVIARHFFDVFNPIIKKKYGSNIRLHSVEIQETPTSKAIFYESLE